MSKVTARAHQPTTVTIELTPDQVFLLSGLRRRWVVDQRELRVVTQVLVSVALQNWAKLKPTLDADLKYMIAEGLPNCLGLWEGRLAAMAKKGFQP